MFEEWEKSRQSLLWGSDIVAFVNYVQRRGNAFAGDFVPGPEFEKVRALVESAVRACQAIEDSANENIEERVYIQTQLLKKIEALEFQFGEPPVPIEAFYIDQLWVVSFDVALWWLVEKDLEVEKTIRDSQFRNIETRFS